jgi:DNA-binding CsgD family transcriptional regulator
MGSGPRRAVIEMRRSHHERGWLEFFAHLLTVPLDALPVEQIALRLHATFDATACGFNDIVNADHRAELWPLDEQLDGHRDALFTLTTTRSQDHPLLRFYLATGQRIPQQTADVPAFAEGSRAACWADIGALTRCPDQLALPLRLQPGCARAFVLGRHGRFCRTAIELAMMVWRLLTVLDRQTTAIESLAALKHAAGMGLTPRETAVLGLLAEGLTAAAIGRRLAISERTVQKHLQRVYTKLHVVDRLTAVLRGTELGLLGRRQVTLSHA